MQKAWGYGALAAAGLATIGFVVAMQPSSSRAGMLLAAWLCFPYVLIALALAFLAKNAKVVRTFTLMAYVLPVGAALFLCYVVYINPDPQGGIAIVFTPLYQLVGAVLLLPIGEWLSSS